MFVKKTLQNLFKKQWTKTIINKISCLIKIEKWNYLLFIKKTKHIFIKEIIKRLYNQNTYFSRRGIFFLWKTYRRFYSMG
jgi:hypothetical protein